MTIEQATYLAKYRTDCTEKNRRARNDWEIKSVSLACIGETDAPA